MPQVVPPPILPPPPIDFQLVIEMVLLALKASPFDMAREDAPFVVRYVVLQCSAVVKLHPHLVDVVQDTVCDRLKVPVVREQVLVRGPAQALIHDAVLSLSADIEVVSVNYLGTTDSEGIALIAGMRASLDAIRQQCDVVTP